MSSDNVELYWADGCGRLAEVDVDLDVAAAIERSDAPVVIGRGVRRTPSWELFAAAALAKDRLAIITSELDELDPHWRLRRLGIDPAA